MLIFEIIRPGTWLDIDNHDSTFEIERVLGDLESQFYTANIALNKFISCKREIEEHTRNLFSDEVRDSERIRKHEIEQDICREIGAKSYEQFEELHFLTEVRFNREKWSAGYVPGQFLKKSIYIYAHAFVSAVDMFGRFLTVLKGQPSSSAIGDISLKKFKEAFPQLRGVRNSVQHMDERSQGLKTGRKPIELKPIDNEAIKCSGGVIAINILVNDRFGITLDDGSYGEVAISIESLQVLGEIFQGILDSFKWRGPKAYLPSA
ncbi:TPA: hypothetical protein SL606_005046 [Pseudomonas aeruginosa]|nr:hypothetical protein [Pseudomonas aeruginosa]